MADICYLQPEAPPQAFQTTRAGYDWDECAAEVVVDRMTVHDGRLVLPDGMSYRLLALPDSTTMTPALLRKVKELVEAGATVVGPRPARSPSLSGYPKCDEEVNSLAALWGKGCVVSDRTAEQVLAEKGVAPDFVSEPLLRFIHKQLGDVELYFVANGRPQAVETVATFRVAGREPELWWPDTGKVERASVYEGRPDVTRVPLRLDASGSVFVVFRPVRPTGDPVVSLARDGRVIVPAVPLSGRVEVRKAVYGVPGDPKRSRNACVKVQALADADHALPGGPDGRW